MQQEEYLSEIDRLTMSLMISYSVESLDILKQHIFALSKIVRFSLLSSTSHMVSSPSGKFPIESNLSVSKWAEKS
jgi:hypothetical protein